MAHCTKCGGELAEGSAFCGSCGAPASIQLVAASGPTAAAQATAMVAPGTPLSMNLAALLSYVLGPITGVIFLVLDPYKTNRFVRFHAMQSILFSVACLILAIVWTIGVDVLVSIAGYWVLTIDVPLHLLVGLGIFLLWLYVMYQAYSQRDYRIPWIGEIAAKQVH